MAAFEIVSFHFHAVRPSRRRTERIERVGASLGVFRGRTIIARPFKFPGSCCSYAIMACDDVSSAACTRARDPCARLCRGNGRPDNIRFAVHTTIIINIYNNRTTSKAAPGRGIVGPRALLVVSAAGGRFVKNSRFYIAVFRGVPPFQDVSYGRVGLRTSPRQTIHAIRVAHGNKNGQAHVPATRTTRFMP